MPYKQQEITSVYRWSDSMFSFKTTRPDDFSFNHGEFVTLGLRPEGKLIPRAYSIVSTNEQAHLEFLSIHVPDGPLTQHLARIDKGHPIWINTKSTGSLTLDHIRPGRNLYLLATGTGLAPFVSLIRAGEVFDSFEKVILVHSVRKVSALAYHDELAVRAGDRFAYLPTATRDEFALRKRGTDLFRSGEVTALLDLPDINPIEDRVMLCGNPQMIREMNEYLRQNGWTRTNYKGLGNYAIEQAFALQ